MSTDSQQSPPVMRCCSCGTRYFKDERHECPQSFTRGVNGILIGAVYRHYKHGQLYRVVGFSTFSGDGELDGQRLIHYEPVAGDPMLCPYSTPENRFRGEALSARFTLEKE